MARKRTFDYEEAKGLRGLGYSFAQIGQALGVSHYAAAYACNENGIRSRMQESVRRSSENRYARCVDCGKRISPYRSVRCVECAGKARIDSVREDTLRCCRCREWKPDEDFPNRRDTPHRRYRHQLCRPCQTIQRREYRRSHPEQAQKENQARVERRRKRRLAAMTAI